MSRKRVRTGVWSRKQRQKKKQGEKADVQKGTLSLDLDKNLQQVRETLGNSTDLIIREMEIGDEKAIRIGIIYMEGLAATPAINHFIMDPLADLESAMGGRGDRPSIHLLSNQLLNLVNLWDLNRLNDVLNTVLSGDTAILMEGSHRGIGARTKGGRDRGVTEPGTQTVIRGPREGFSEDLRTNTALVRRKIKDPRLWLETRSIGRVSHTDVAVMYIRGIADGQVVEEVRRRLDRMDVDGILESGYIEESIQDEVYTPFPTVNNTERPDIVAGHLMEGHVAILVDGTPFVLLVPALFTQFYQSAEDYYQRWDIATAVRILRFVSMLIALLAPSIYIAITTFHQELLPVTLLASIAAQREGVPFPAFVEAVMMEYTFEILREAGIRMPRTVGQAVSIVGTLVVGLAAVEAGLVSAAMVIVVSITAISSFVTPAYNMAISVRLLRFLFMGLAASFGLFGVIIGLIALVLHLCSLRSFGVPYLSSVAPYQRSDQKDTFFRLPGGFFSRPQLISHNPGSHQGIAPRRMISRK